MLEYLTTLASPATLGSILVEFLSVVLFAIGVLALGRWLDWPAGHLTLPVLGWAYAMTSRLEEAQFNYEPVHPEIFILPFLEGIVALLVLLALVGLAAALRPPRPAGRLEGFCWISALVAVATVALDWAFLLMLYVVPLRG